MAVVGESEIRGTGQKSVSMLRRRRSFRRMALALCMVAGYTTLAQNAAPTGVTTTGATTTDTTTPAPASTEISQSTPAHLEAGGWWPTKGDLPRKDYVGQAVCLSCHELKASYKDSAMAHAATPAADAASLHEPSDRLAFKLGAYSYQISNADGKSVMKVSRGSASDSETLRWAFGMGRIAQTYVYERNGTFFESHLSFYTALQGLDITPGHPRTEPPNLQEAAGRAVPVKEIRRCFGCHTTASITRDGFDTRTPFPGVMCEACHGPGAKHAAAMKAGDYDAGVKAILNPLLLDPVESVDFCGACHRTLQDVVLDSPVRRAELNVRFQPYRIENSRCWKEGKGATRISCLSCHDPHQPLSMDPASYDSSCLQCHRAAGAQPEKKTADADARHRTACTVGVKLCVTCHMPRFKSSAMHATFTDHWIRIAEPGARLPD